MSRCRTVVADVSGEALADKLTGTLASVDITKSGQLASICSDGEHWRSSIGVDGILTFSFPFHELSIPIVSYSRSGKSWCFAWHSSVSRSLKHRIKGPCADGGRKNTAISTILGAMHDIQWVADLESIRSSRPPIQVWLMVHAIKRLTDAGLIPPSVTVTPECLRDAYDTLHTEKYACGGNKSLLKAMWRDFWIKPSLKPFLD